MPPRGPKKLNTHQKRELKKKVRRFLVDVPKVPLGSYTVVQNVHDRIFARGVSAASSFVIVVLKRARPACPSGVRWT